MTTLVRTVRRETAARIQGKTLCIEVTPWEIVLRRKGTRLRYSVPLEAIWSVGGKLARMEYEKAHPRKRRK